MVYNRLWGMRCYLIGPMDRVPDGGEEWRERITPFLEDLGVVVLNPCHKPIDIGIEDKENRKLIDKLKAAEKYDELKPATKPIRLVDLRMTDMADFCIKYCNIDVHECGSYEEAFWANRLKNSILVMCEQGKKCMPSWMFAVIPHQHMFGDWESLKEYLNHVNQDEIVDTYNRWVFFKFHELLPKVPYKGPR